MNSAPTSDAAAAGRPPLRRDGQRKMLLGVCAGIARTLDADPVLVRAIVIVIGLLAGPLAVVAYVATAVITPRDDGRMLLSGDPPDSRENWLGWIGVIVAAITLIASGPVFDGFWGDDPVTTPLLAVALIAGVIVLIRANRDRTATVAASAIPMPPASEAPTTQATAATVVAAVATPEAAEAPTATLPTVRTWAPRGGVPPTHSDPPPPPEPAGPSIFLPVAGVITGAAAIATVVDAVGLADLSASAVAVLLASGAVVAGAAAALASGMRGRVLTLVLAIVLAVSAAGTAILSDQFQDGVGERHIRPASAADLLPEYRLGVGLLDLDLRDIAFPDGVTTVRAHVGAGQIQLEVPDNVQVVPVGDTSIGGASLAPIDAPKEGQSAPVLRIDADVDVGGPVDVIR